jgi:hypothetical protein
MSTWPERSSIEDLYPLSSMQEGMLFHSISAPGTGMYVEQFTCTLRGPLDVDAFKQAWERVIQRHSVRSQEGRSPVSLRGLARFARGGSHGTCRNVPR